jgi:chromosome segregation ATPase
MIVTLSRTICQQLEESGRLEQQQNEVKNIQATLDTLNKLKSTIHDFRIRYQAICSRIPPENVEYIQQQATTLVQEIETSRNNFANNRRQVPALSKTEKAIKKMMQDIEAQWKSYANDQIKPLAETLTLIRALPEIARQEEAINSLLTRLRTLAKTLPSSYAELTEFDTTHQQLERRLATLEGLSPAIHEFLQKVQHGTATLNDLSNDILDWCRQGDHASTFTISFRRNKGD